MAAACPDPKALILAPTYPLGLLYFATAYPGSGSFVFIGYVAFALLPICILFARRLGYFTLFVSLFVIVSSLNVRGCHQTLREFHSIDR